MTLHISVAQYHMKMSLKRYMYHKQKKSFYAKSIVQPSYKSLCCIHGRQSDVIQDMFDFSVLDHPRTTIEKYSVGSSFATSTNSLLASWLDDLEPYDTDGLQHHSCIATELREDTYARDSVLETAFYEEDNDFNVQHVPRLIKESTVISSTEACIKRSNPRKSLVIKLQTLLKKLCPKSSKLNNFKKKRNRPRLCQLSRSISRRK